MYGSVRVHMVYSERPEGAVRKIVRCAFRVSPAAGSHGSVVGDYTFDAWRNP
jgi:hypothetical protein